MSGSGTSHGHAQTADSSPVVSDVQSAMQRLDRAVRGIRLRAHAEDQVTEGDAVVGRIGRADRRAA